MHIWSLFSGMIAALGLLILPGAWVTFCLPGSDLPFWPRFWIGVALSPLVVLLEWYAVRAMGLSFGATCWLLALANLPVGFLVLRQARGAGGVDQHARAGLVWVLVVTAGVFGIYFAHRAMFGHSWMHTDVVYQLANGRLRPEEPVMAGMRLAYPWFGHVQPAAFSYVVGATPLATYMWPNVVYLLSAMGLTWLIAERLGAGPHARVWSLIFLLFGVNLVGYALAHTLPTEVLRGIPDMGGFRYTPWIRRFLSFEQEQTIIPMFSALLWLGVDRPGGITGHRWVLAALLLSAVGVIYSIVLPAACIIIGAAGLVLLSQREEQAGDRVRQLAALAGVVLVAALTTYGAVRWVTEDSVGGIGIAITSLREMAAKGFTIVIVSLPLILAAAWITLRSSRAQLVARAIPLLAGVGSMALFVVFQISQGGGNEYKFVFTVAAALAPLAALAVDPALGRLASRALPVTVIGLLVFAAPAYHKWWSSERAGKREVPVKTDRFSLALGDDQRLASATAALRDSTLVSTVIVARDPGLHLPTLTRRVLYAPYSNEYLPGANLRGDLMLSNVKGYPPSTLTNRRRVLHEFFEPGSAALRAEAMRELEGIHRPLGIIVDETRDAGLSAFMASVPDSRRLSSDSGVSVWLVPPR